MSVVKGDCLDELRKIKEETIDLIYLDPPFYTGRTQKQKTRDNKIEYSFEDKWSSVGCYTDYLKERLIECRRVLKTTGTIYLHCDQNASHYLRVIMDEIFSSENFINEIIWMYKRWSNSKKGLLSNHQNIYFYSKSSDYTFNTIYTDYSPTTNIDQILQNRTRNEHNKSIYKRDKNGDIVHAKEKRGVPLSDVWEIPYLNPKAKERTGYPTQKPLLLLERLIEVASNKDDIVLDPFCGSGTTLVAAKLLERRYIGIDISADAVAIAKERLDKPIKTKSFLLEKGIDSYINKDESVRNIIDLINGTVVQRNKGIDGFLKDSPINKPVAIYIQRKGEPLKTSIELIRKACKNKGDVKMIVIKTDETDNLTHNIQEDMSQSSVIVVDDINLVVKQMLEKNDNGSLPLVQTNGNSIIVLCEER